MYTRTVYFILHLSLFINSAILQRELLQLEISRIFCNFINPLNTKRRLFYLKAQFIPRSKHFSSRL